MAVSPTVNQSYGETGRRRARRLRHQPDGPGLPARRGARWHRLRGLDWTAPTTISMKGAGEIYVGALHGQGRDVRRRQSSPAPSTRSRFRPRNAFFRFWASQFPQIAIGPDGRALHRLRRPAVGRAARRRRHLPGQVHRRGPDLGPAPSGSTTTTPRRSSSSRPSTSRPTARVHVMWGDMRDDPAQSRYNIYYTALRGRRRDLGLRERGPGHQGRATPGSPTSPPTPTAASPAAGSWATTSRSRRPTTRCTWSGPTRASASTARRTMKIGFARQEADPGAGALPVAAVGSRAASR